MAEADYNVADRNIESLQAGDKVQETVASTPDKDSADAAAAAGVRSAAFIDYADALTAHTNRADIESLDSRVRRDTGLTGATFAAADHMRGVSDDTPPTPGSVNGVAPAVTGETFVAAQAQEDEGETTTQSEPTNEEPTLAARQQGDSDGDGKDDNKDATKA